MSIGEQMTASISRSGEHQCTVISNGSGTTNKKTKISSSIGTRISNHAVLVGRIFFICFLIVIAIILGYLTFSFLTNEEINLAETQFDSIASRALYTIPEIANRKRLGTISMASILSNAFPNATKWPYVTLDGYEEIATNLIDTSSGREMGFCPLVTPDQLDDFETFAYNFFERDRNPPFPNGTGMSSFGKGVWGVNPNLNTTDNRYHETDGTTYYGSPNKIFAPILQHNAGAFPALLLNLHFQEARGDAIDSLIDCAMTRATTQEDGSSSSSNCLSITDMLILTSQETEPGPGALIMQPIFPKYDNTTLVGLIASSVVWDEVLFNVFADETSGIDCVLETETQVYTYTVQNGIAILRGEGDLHDTDYDKYHRSVTITGEGLFSPASAVYTIHLYPEKEFFNVYGTQNPMISCIGAVLIILFTSCVFFGYDRCVRKEFNAKKELLSAKRQFVRFVSHEVRTPLNSVCMGLSLMQEEIAFALGVAPDADLSSSPTLALVPPPKTILADTTTTTHPVSVSTSGPRSGTSSSSIIDRENAADWFGLTQEILLNAQSSVDVLNDLLNYDKIEMGNLSLEQTIIPIWKLVEMTTLEFRVPTTKKEIKLDLEFEHLKDDEAGQDEQDAAETANTTTTLGRIHEGLSTDVKDRKVVGDTVRITQVLRNLLSNGMKFTPKGGSLSVRVSWEKKKEESIKSSKKHHHQDQAIMETFALKNGDELSAPFDGVLRVAVTDTGAGMSDDQLGKLFNDGVQFNVNELQQGQGSGIGLYISKGIMEQHGGSLVASSRGLGKGTTFTMTLPLFHVPDKVISGGQAKEEEPYSGQQPSTACSGPVEVASLRVLIVDDSSTNRKLLKRLLQNHGHICDEAEDGRVAITMVEKTIQGGKTYDTILMDYEMPLVNGPQAAKEIRSMGCDSFIVGITGNVMSEDVNHFKQSGANAVLPKPFKLADLDQLWVEYGVSGNADTQRSEEDAEKVEYA